MKEENSSMEVEGFELLHKTLCDMGCDIAQNFDDAQNIAFYYEGMPYLAVLKETAICFWQINWYALSLDDPYLPLLMDVIEKANLRKVSGVRMSMGKPDEDGVVGVHCCGIIPNHISFYDEHNIVKSLKLMALMKEWVTSHFLLFVNHECQHWPDDYATCYN